MLRGSDAAGVGLRATTRTIAPSTSTARQLALRHRAGAHQADRLGSELGWAGAVGSWAWGPPSAASPQALRSPRNRSTRVGRRGNVCGMANPPAQAERAAAFLQLHHGDRPLLIPNPWDRGSAKLLASLGFKALATTSGGFAASLGRLDGHVTRDEALGHAALIAAATDLPVSADLENCFADDPAGVADTIQRAIAVGLCGCSVEDYTRDPAA